MQSKSQKQFLSESTQNVPYPECIWLAFESDSCGHQPNSSKFKDNEHNLNSTYSIGLTKQKSYYADQYSKPVKFHITDLQSLWVKIWNSWQLCMQ